MNHEFKTECPECGESGMVLAIGGTSGSQHLQPRKFDKVCYTIDTGAYVHIREGDRV